jgi:hypothetical protein
MDWAMEFSAVFLILGLVFGPCVLAIAMRWIELHYAKKDTDRS